MNLLCSGSSARGKRAARRRTVSRCVGGVRRRPRMDDEGRERDCGRAQQGLRNRMTTTLLVGRPRKGEEAALGRVAPLDEGSTEDHAATSEDRRLLNGRIYSTLGRKPGQEAGTQGCRRATANHGSV
ncbi:hypothetical protein NITMOv2_3941 [Nitrospira moscoviensis]|uniref:Uncharacterized protein n=1 Tax=Nitrospira moscoviensis TaxID=42253 RepID=A0A0K2GHB3_NITMO|nr:hypothetical protein NITMOv2_3941 [Nitrospira moscoviensis]